MNPKMITVAVLKARELERRGLPTYDKDIIARLDRDDPSGKWVKIIAQLKHLEIPQFEIVSGERAVARVSEEESGRPENESTRNVEDRAENAKSRSPLADIRADDNPNVARLARRYEEMQLELERRENELLRRELELVRRENEQLRLPTMESAPRRENVSALLELVGFFDRTAGTFRKWKQQIRQVCVVYHLDDDRAKLLISNKLRGKAKTWFQAEDTIIIVSMN